MRSVAILIFLFFSLSSTTAAQTEDLIILRNLSSGNSITQAAEMTRLLDKTIPSPIFNGYRSIALLIHSKSSISPFDKLKYFKSGKEMLEESIYSDKTSIELRYLRFCIQTTVPFFLSYSGNIEEDKKMIIQNWGGIYDSDLKDRIRKYMMRSEYCNDHEKNRFGNG